MSGGYFDYIQDRFDYDLIDRLEDVINTNNKIPYPEPESPWDIMANQDFIESGSKRFSDETIDEFKKGLLTIKKAQIYIQRIDYLLCGDDDEKSFHERLKTEFDELSKETPIN